MRATALTNATPDARSLQNRTASDGTPTDDGFGTALADVAQAGSDAAQTPTTGGAVAAPVVAASILPDTGQGIAALLAKLASGATSAADGQSVTAATKGEVAPTAASGETSTTTKSDKASDDTQGAAPVPTDPVAAMAALLPGLVSAPIVAAGASPAKASPNSSKPSLSLGDAATASAAHDLGVHSSNDDATAAETGVGFTLVASATHLAPVSPAPTQATVHAVDPATKDVAKSATPVSTGDTPAPTVSAETEASAHDLTLTAAVPAHAAASASLPDGTLQSLANSVTSFAADVASASSAATPSAAATVTDPTTTSVAPARSLTLQLTPGDLGSVTVRLHMTSNGLDVDLAVDDRKTLASISHARDELASAIGDNGYRVESLTIRGSDASSTSTAGSNDSARSQGESGAGQSFSGGSSGSSGGDAASSRQRPSQSSAAPRDPGRDRGADGVFV